MSKSQFSRVSSSTLPFSDKVYPGVPSRFCSVANFGHIVSLFVYILVTLLHIPRYPDAYVLVNIHYTMTCHIE